MTPPLPPPSLVSWRRLSAHLVAASTRCRRRPSLNRSRGAAFVVVVSIACAMLAGCGTPSADPTPQDHPMANAPVRTDLEPLRKHFPRLGRMVTAHWQGRAVGADSWAPGPSDVLVQALAVLDPTDLQSIAAGYTWDRATIHWDSGMTDQLRPFLPVNGDWRWCEPFEAAVRTSAYSGEVYVDLRSGTVYLDISTT